MTSPSPARSTRARTPVCWVRIEGGICRFGDAARPIRVKTLEWTQTVITYAHLGRGGEDRPLTGLSQPAAARIAQELGARLPRSVEWEWAAAGPHRRTYPWGEEEPTADRANLRQGIGQPAPVRSFLQGATPDGLLQMAGNVWEWTSSTVLGGGFVLRGASFTSPALYAKTTFLNAAPAELESAGIGLRMVREP
ncbi:formylglycine-generating enzyme family protein [Streptomyces sp. NPDC048172]|uniref:formylglycine-generating enzyme family protein n=1 Tax=Streptomyces sp. NPDC048172 TaxID=3365505 RepID=UPI0037213E9E